MNNNFSNQFKSESWPIIVSNNPVVFYLQSKSWEAAMTKEIELRLFQSHKVYAVMLWEGRGERSNHSCEPAVPPAWIPPSCSNPFLHLHPSPPPSCNGSGQLAGCVPACGPQGPAGQVAISWTTNFVDIMACYHPRPSTSLGRPARWAGKKCPGLALNVPTAPPASPQWRPGWRPVEGRKCPQRHEWWMKRQEEGMGSSRGAGHAHRGGTVCDRPFAGSLIGRGSPWHWKNSQSCE